MDAEKLKEELRQLIQEQLQKLYDFPDDFQVQLLKYSENIVYKIVFCGSQAFPPVVLRVHRPGYHDTEELESELLWMEEIARDTDVPVPRVFRGKDGGLIQQLYGADGRAWNCSVISFLEGRLLEQLSGEELLKAMEQMGEITAKLHLQAIHRDPGVILKRGSWDVHNFFDEDGVWGSWRDYPGLDAEQYLLLEQCQQVITARLARYGKSPERYGMIHSDLHFCNIIRKDGVNQIFDFDDCGYGYYLYDLGCTLVTCSENLSGLQEAWVRGYVRYRPLTGEDRELLPMFILLRRIVRLGWLASHAGNDTGKRVGSEYLDVTMELAADWLRKDRKEQAKRGREDFADSRWELERSAG